MLTLLMVAFVAIGIGVAGRVTGDEPGGTTTVADSSAVPADFAPDFTVELLDGTTFTLSEHLATDGRPVLLNFWASWCGPCRAEMPDLDVLAASKPGLFVLGVAVSDSPEKAREFADEINVSYALGIDESETVAAAYPFIGLPSTWFIGQDQTIELEIIGFMTFEQMQENTAAAFGF